MATLDVHTCKKLAAENEPPMGVYRSFCLRFFFLGEEGVFLAGFQRVLSFKVKRYFQGEAREGELPFQFLREDIFEKGTKEREDGLAQEGRCLLRLGWRYLLGRERRLRRKKSEGG